MPTSVTRQFVFAHYTSYDIRSREPSDDTWVPLAPTIEGCPFAAKLPTRLR
jgi:hypothetical protein